MMIENAFRYDPESGLILRHSGDVACVIRSGGYRIVWHDGRDYYAHILAFRLMLGRMPMGKVDHINRVRSDNRWINLREGPHRHNLANSPPRNRLGLKGVREQNGRFVAQIGIHGKLHYLGRYDTAEEAADVYEKRAIEEYGEFAWRRR